MFLGRSNPAEVGRIYPKRIDPRWLEIPKTGGDFVVAAKTIRGGEPEQRKRAEELKAKRSRNLTTRVERASVYLARMLPRLTNEDGEKTLNMEEAERRLKSVLPEVKAVFGWPSENPVESSYRINEVVMKAASGDIARKNLEREIPHGIILPARLKLIAERLRLDLKDEAEPILEVLEQTASRDHLALISISADRDGETRVLLVDEAKNRLEIPAWKLVDLLANPGAARRLYVFPRDYQQERYPEVVFNEERTGDLIAKYLPEESSLRVMVVAVSKDPGNHKARAASRPVTFYLDQDYLACLWLVLRRVTEDRQRYRELMERAEAQTDFDPFSLR